MSAERAEATCSPWTLRCIMRRPVSCFVQLRLCTHVGLLRAGMGILSVYHSAFPRLRVTLGMDIRACHRGRPVDIPAQCNSIPGMEGLEAGHCEAISVGIPKIRKTKTRSRRRSEDCLPCLCLVRRAVQLSGHTVLVNLALDQLLTQHWRSPALYMITEYMHTWL